MPQITPTPVLTRRTLPMLLAMCSGWALATQPAQSADEPTDQESNTADAEKIESAPPKSWSFGLSGGATFAGDADFDNGIGEFSYDAYELSISARRLIGDSGSLSIELKGGLIDYTINPSTSSAVGDAANIGAEFDTITTIGLTGMYAHRIDDTSSWFVSGGVISAGEDDADFGDTLDGLALAGYKHKFSDTLEMGFGAFVRTRLDDDALIVPIITLSYRPDDRWTIASEGLGLKIDYKASDALNYGISAEYDSDTFRLDDSHTLARGGVASHSRIPVWFYTQYKASDTIELSARIGVEFAGELEILNTSGNEITSQDIDTGIFGSFNISFRF